MIAVGIVIVLVLEDIVLYLLKICSLIAVTCDSDLV